MRVRIGRTSIVVRRDQRTDEIEEDDEGREIRPCSLVDTVERHGQHTEHLWRKPSPEPIYRCPGVL